MGQPPTPLSGMAKACFQKRSQVGRDHRQRFGGGFDENGSGVAYWAVLHPESVKQSEPAANSSVVSTASVSLEAEVPEVLFEGMREFIRSHPSWDQYSVITSALAGFLFQNGSCDSRVRDHYLDGLLTER